MAHLILLGDSIFDNTVYVPNDPPVIQQVQKYLSERDRAASRATLLAVDGDAIQDIFRQLDRVPEDATHFFISVGGNDALQYAARLLQSNQSPTEMLKLTATMKNEFDRNYQRMLEAVLSLRKPTVLCTIYDRCPLLDPAMRLLAITALSMFNDCITRQAVQAGLPLIDLRVICDEATDYSAISPIEPSAAGGDKIARRIVAIAAEHDFSMQHTVVYT
jgi:lysophospholipase L1-like esterase